MSRIPSYRFSMYSDSLVLITLGELEQKGHLKLKRGKVISARDISEAPGEYPVYSSSVRNLGEMGRYGKYMLDKESVSWSIDGGGDVFYRPAHRYSVTNVCGYVEVTEQVDCAFLAAAMQYKHSTAGFNYTMKAHPSVIRDLYEIGLPTIGEQRSIGDLLKKLDCAINQQEQKIALLEDAKRTMLAKMFPKKGEDRPEIRFEGFDGDWTEKKLGDVSTVQTGKLNANAMTEDGEYPFFTCAKETYATDSYAFDDESLLIAGNGEIGLVKYYNGKFNAYQRTYVLTDIIEDVKFLENVLNIYLPEQIQIMTFGSTMPYITMGTLTDLSVFIPSLEEQQAIGQFFKTFDELIEKQKEKVENAETMKKALLQKMFV